MGIEPKFRKFKSVQKLQEIADEMIAEYDHGTADYQDCAGVTAEQYKAVIEDFLLYAEGVEYQNGQEQSKLIDHYMDDELEGMEDEKEVFCPKDKNHKVVFSATGYYCDVCKSRIQI